MIAKERLARRRLCLAGESRSLSNNIETTFARERERPKETAKLVGPREQRDNGTVRGLSGNKELTHNSGPLL